MKVTVNKFLNVRVGKPSLNAPNYQYLAPGSELQVDGKLYKGDTYEGIDTWLKDEAGNYYWSGGVERENVLSESNSFDLPNLLNIEGLIPKGNGEGIVIAVLDSGIVDGHSFFKNVITHKNFVNNEVTIKNGHGTNVAGVILGNDSIIKGLATDSKILDYKVIKNNNAVDNIALLNALSDLVSNNVVIDILNLSLDIMPAIIPKVTGLIDTLVNRGTVVIAAGGNSNVSNFTTRIKSCICIGTFLKEDKNKILENCIFSYLNLPFRSTDLKSGHADFNDDSAYTAFTTGLVAKFLSSNDIERAKRNEKVKEFLKLSAAQLSNQVLNFKPYTNEN